MMYFYILVTISSFVVCNTAPLLPGYIQSYDDSIDGELGGHFEGDMLLTPTQMSWFQDGATWRNGLRNEAKRWPKSTVIYHIKKNDFDDAQLKMIEDAMLDISNRSCVKFRERENDEQHAVVFQSTDKNQCYSGVGYHTQQSEESEGYQVLNLGPACFRHGTIMHEMLHTLGFYHMQNTYNRDDYVKIVWENVMAGKEHNFIKYSNDTVTDFGVEYDYDSVMHYPQSAFSKNGERTIIPLQENVDIGQRIRLSEKDIIKLNKMYCNGS